MTAPISKHFLTRSPSPIRQAQIDFALRPDRDQVRVVNLAIGNVSRPMHPKMRDRMVSLGAPDSPFAEGIVKYTATVGTQEAQDAFRNIIGTIGCRTDHLQVVVTDGGSQAMELMVLGVCGPASQRPLLLLDPAYTNYMDMARRAAARTVSTRRELSGSGEFTLPDLAELKRVIKDQHPAGLVIIPADNPTGQFMEHEDVVAIAKLCVDHDLWLVSDEAYRQLQYDCEQASSVWALSEQDVPGITGRRISIESASKVWNACGLRLGALVTDNPEFHRRAVAEYTANLSANALGQYIFGALAHESHEELRVWFSEQRTYYATMMREVAKGLRDCLPGIIVSQPKASLYSVIDVRELAPPEFKAADFVAYCAKEGRAFIEGADHTLLVSPMGGFYGGLKEADSSSTQMRMAFVEPMEEMKKVPRLFAALFEAYLSR